METVLGEDSPFATFLEGEGTLEHSLLHIDDSPSVESSTDQSFVPPPTGSLRSHFKNRAPTNLRLKLPRQSRLSEAHIAWSKAINSRIGRSKNVRFLEHFRYILIASQLLNEYQDHGSHSAVKIPTQESEHKGKSTATQQNPLDVNGLCLTVGVAFLAVWATRWTFQGQKRLTKAAITIVVISFLATVTYAYLRRQWLEYIRHQAVESASAMTTNLQALEVSAGSAMALIQEVELVSKGYRLSAPLPPISRLDDAKAARRCAGLRRQLCKVYQAAIPALMNGIESLRASINDNDYDKYLDVYDIPRGAVQEAITTDVPDDYDVESLGALKMLYYKCSTLRRVFLCSLLSLEADGGAPDFWRWRMATDIMDTVSRTAAGNAKALSETLKDLEEFAAPPTTPKKASKAGNERVRTQVRKISTLSQGIRSIQAKMMLLREESNKALESSDDLSDLGPSLMAQYESIGNDLKSLMADWETGKAALASNIGKHERRISMASSGLRSPGSSLGGLTAVDEDSENNGGPADALRALLGEKESSSKRSSFAASNSDEEVFEAIAMPRVRERSSLTREERIIKMNEERARLAENREKRMSNTNMIKELQSVINLRRPIRNSVGRITSI